MIDISYNNPTLNPENDGHADGLESLIGQKNDNGVPILLKLDGEFFALLNVDGYDDPEKAEAEATPLRGEGCRVYVRYYNNKWYQFILV